MVVLFFVVSIPSDRGIRSGASLHSTMTIPYFVSIPSDRGIRSGYQIAFESRGREFVSIPSDRGIRSGSMQAKQVIFIIFCLNPL